MAACCEWRGDQLILNIRLQPRASRDKIVGLHQDRLKICITAPPVDGKANAYLLRYLAAEFGVAKGAVTLLAGKTGRDKRVAIRAPRKTPAVLAEACQGAVTSRS